MDTQKTQARVQLGALIKRERRAAGMKKQDDLAAKTGLSVSVVSLAERGSKVEPNTLRQIEIALGFPTGSFEDYVSGRGELPARDAFAASAATSSAPSVLTMSRAELVAAAMVVEEVYGAEAGDRFLQDALAKRAQTTRTSVRDQAG